MADGANGSVVTAVDFGALLRSPHHVADRSHSLAEVSSTTNDEQVAEPSPILQLRRMWSPGHPGERAILVAVFYGDIEARLQLNTVAKTRHVHGPLVNASILLGRHLDLVADLVR